MATAISAHGKLKTTCIGWERRYQSTLASKVCITPRILSANAYAPHMRTPKIALDVLTGVTSEYLLNVGRMIQFPSDKYGNEMSAEVGLKYISLGSMAPSY